MRNPEVSTMSHLPSLRSKNKHIKAVSQKRKLFRANNPLLSVFMWGINHSINELKYINIPVMLMSDDFKSYSKVRIDNHAFNKENLPSHFKCKEYCPLVFRNLRERFGVDDSDYLRSLTRSQPTCCGPSPGKSNARLLISYDRRFVIKTIASEDVEQMHHILKQYHHYIVERHGDILLPQYLGMHRLTVDGQETYMIVMRNIFSATLNIHKKYDLKGSTVDRQASEKEKIKEIPTYKDNDFIEHETSLYLSEEVKKGFLEKLESDVNFLCTLKLMDYSLLIGIHDVSLGQEEGVIQETADSGSEDIDTENGGDDLSDDLRAIPEDGGTISGDDDGAAIPTPPDSPKEPSAPGEFDPKVDVYALRSHEGSEKDAVYFVALIDTLTHWGTRKKAALAAKTVKHGAGAEISTVNPEMYAKRFIDFICRVIFEGRSEFSQL